MSATPTRMLVALATAAAIAIPCVGLGAEEQTASDDVAPLTEAPEEPAEEGDEAVPTLSARGRYNLGLSHLADGELEAAAEEFLAARDGAGPDPELRYRAAFNLGFALAAQAGLGGADHGIQWLGDEPTPEPPVTEQDQSPEEIIDTLRQSAAWFSDAVRLAPVGDEDARINLEVVSRWILQLADQLNQSDRLEARLDRLIDDQRGLRDQVRRLLTDIAAEGAGTEPVGFTAEFEALASRERVLLAEVGDVIDLAAEERLHIEQAPEQERSPAQQSRAYQLAAVTDYLERARQSLSDARRRLRRLEGERGHRRVDAALAELKRAREQLLDPVTVLKAVTRDEQELVVHSRALAAFSEGTLSLERDPPAWLTAKHLEERQEDIAVRTGGVLSRFEAIAASDPSAASGPEAEAAKRMVAVAAEAVPILDSGLASMRAAISALESGDASAAVPEEQRAIEAVAEAIELFADVKSLIELAYGTQQGIVALLTPGEQSEDETLTAAEREALATKLVADNQRRIDRLEALLEEEAASANAEAGEDADHRQALEQRYELAEALRARASDSLSRLADRVAEGAVADARSSAGETLEYLEELRRLFFSIVEHVAALLADQADTHDRSATLEAESSAAMGDEYAPAVGAVAERQRGHAGLGDELAAALAQQADAANTAAQPNAADASTAPADPAAGERLANAADEVRKASGRMLAAATMLADGAERAKTMSPILEPALEDQLAAMEHLENALKELVPPEQRQQPQGEDGQQGETGEAQPEAAEDEQMSQRQALRRLQAIRDREAERQRNRADHAAEDPVEKDW